MNDAAPEEAALTSPSSSRLLPALLEALRPKQWTKNILLLVALVFSRHAFDLPYVLKALAATGLFCIFSSVGYLFNDLMDIEADRGHPKKRTRPLASGRLPVRMAVSFMVVGLVGALLAAFWLSVPFGLTSLAYVILTFTYTLYIKHMVILDVMGLAAGFILRAVAGATAITVPISPWFLTCTAFFALFIALSKRWAELLLLGKTAGNHRKILEEYSPELLDRMTNIAATGAIMSYALYTFDGSGHPDKPRWMMVTVPFVLYGVFRYQYLVSRKNEGGAPELILLTDRPLQVDILLYVVTVLIILTLG